MGREFVDGKSVFGYVVTGAALVFLLFVALYWFGFARPNRANVPFHDDVRWGHGEREITSAKGPPHEVTRDNGGSAPTVELTYTNQLYLGHRGVLVYVTEPDGALRKVLFKVRYDEKRECLGIFSDLEGRITTSLTSVEPERSRYNRLKGVPFCNAVILGKASKITHWNIEDRNTTVSLYMGQRSKQHVVVLVERESRKGLAEATYDVLRSLLETLRFTSS